MKSVAIKLLLSLLLLAIGAAAQPAITDVVNAGSRIASGFPNYGIAKGALFVVTGKALGPDQLIQGSFPLPTWDGLGGTSVLVSVGDTATPGIMVYSSATEVAGILMSSTPAGDGTLTLTYNGESATVPIKVVDAAWGTFTQNRTGNGAALAFNATDGDPVLNTLLQPAQPGQTVILNGTGAGAIGADETQGGVTEAPATSLQVWVGNKQATVVSAGRGTCCTGLDPSFPIPQGVAGWDVLQFTVPDGVAGCRVPVVVQAGSLVSNFATISVAAAGTACTDPSGFSAGDVQNLTGPVRMGTIILGRSSVKISSMGMAMEMKSDSGSATFTRFEPAELQNVTSQSNVSSIGSCIVATSKISQTDPPVTVTPAVTLDAGNAVNVKGNGTSKQMPKMEGGFYSGNFGTATSIPLPFPIPGAVTPFLEPGTFTADNGSGGADVGAFNASLTVPQPLVWKNQDDINEVDRTQGVTVTWSGGDPNSFVTIVGSSTNKDLSGIFMCTEQVGANRFTVPAVVTLSLPPSTVESSPEGSTPTGIMHVQTSVSGKFTAPGLDLGYITSSVSAMKNLTYK